MRDAGEPSDAATGAPTSHLLMTEVKTNPMSLEFIEIYNPGCAAVDLSSYFLTDDPTYGLLPSWGDAPPDLESLDIVLRFPAGATLAEGEAAVIARDELSYTTGFGFAPTFALRNATLSEPMEIVARGDTEDFELRNEGEPVTLFRR